MLYGVLQFKVQANMWHEARRQERKIRGLLVDYKKRADRRREFYEKIVSLTLMPKCVYTSLHVFSKNLLGFIFYFTAGTKTFMSLALNSGIETVSFSSLIFPVT